MPQPRSGGTQSSPAGHADADANGEATHGVVHNEPKDGMHTLPAHGSAVGEA
jgi:hypothetical protein